MDHPDSPDSRRLQENRPPEHEQTVPSPPDVPTWHLFARLVGLFNDNPVARRDAGGSEHYPLVAAGRRYREARVLDSLALEQDLRLLSCEQTQRTHAAWLTSSLY